MQVPLEITYRDVLKTDEIDTLIQQKSEKLDGICDYITSCRVAVERRQKRERNGTQYRVRIDLTIPPGHELIINQDHSKGNPHLDLPAEIRAAFDVAERRVKELMERQRRDVKVHPEQSTQGVILRLFSDQDYGFIRALDGRELYFHKNSVLHSGFSDLKVGTGVRYNEEIGEQGPQASSVQIVENPGFF